jgi:hypothetical protein
MEKVFDEWSCITVVRLGLTGARPQISVGWKQICAVVKRSLFIGIQRRLPWNWGVETGSDPAAIGTAVLGENVWTRVNI